MISVTSVIREQIFDARRELDIVKNAIKKKNDDVVPQLGLDAWRKQIAEEKKGRVQTIDLPCLVRFVSLPRIKVIWKQFCHAIIDKINL